MNNDRLTKAGELPDKPRLNRVGLWDMNFGFLGIQFGWGLQMANMSAIYTKLGADADKIPLLGLAGPITGLLVQPIIGAMSDRTWSPRFGRRRPYFATGAVLASIVLFVMPSSSALWLAAGLLWLLDAGINISMEPFRAFVADKLPISQRAQGFLMQSFFIGVGATLANVMPWLLHHFGVLAEARNGVPLSVLYSFRAGAFVLLACVMWTVLRTPENPPTDMDSFARLRRSTGGISAGLREIFAAVRMMPVTMKTLFWVQFLTWYGLSCFWAFFTLAVARHVFGAPNSKSPLFDRATEWAGVCMAAYSVVCFLVAPALSSLAARVGRPRLHAAALLIGGVGFAAIGLIHNRDMLLIPMACFGIAWAAILALPYAILSVALPPARVGVYMGIFNFFIVLPQVAASLTLPLLMSRLFGEDPLKAVVLGGFCLVAAAAAATLIVEAAPTVAVFGAVDSPDELAADSRAETVPA